MFYFWTCCISYAEPVLFWVSVSFDWFVFKTLKSTLISDLVARVCVLASSSLPVFSEPTAQAENKWRKIGDGMCQ